MEAWNIKKYESPYLAISGVHLDNDTREVILKEGINEYVIDHGDDVTGQEVVTRLQALRDPNSTAWQELLSAPPSSAWRDLLEAMDNLGLLRDAVSEGESRRDAEISTLRDSIATCVEHVLLEVKSAWRQELLANVGALSRHCLSLTIELLRNLPLQNSLELGHQRPLSFPEIFQLENFYQQIAMVQSCYQRSHAPLSLVCCTYALLSLTKHLEGMGQIPPFWMSCYVS